MVESLLISLPNKVKKSSTSSSLPAVCCRLRLLFLISSFPLYSHDDKENHRCRYGGGGGVYAIDVPESEFVTSSTVFGTGDHHEHSLVIDDYDHEIWNNNVKYGNEDPATSRHLRKRKEKESSTTTVEEDDQDGHALQTSADSTDPPVPIISDLEMCFMHNDFTIHYSSNDVGSNVGPIPVSNIPVPDSAFNNGLFIQNVTGSVCYDDDGKLDPYCVQNAQVYCKYCVFDESMMKESSLTLELDSLPSCRDEVAKIAEECKETDCIRVRPLVGHQNNSNSTYDVKYQRKLLQDDNILGNDKARWMTSLGAQLGSEIHKVILADFVLPGSHNSKAVKMSHRVCSESMIPLPSLPVDSRNKVAKCQDTSIWNQLESGIRYFDIRVVDAADFYGLKYPLHHSYLIDDEVNTMEKALEIFSRFLDNNPGEFVIARIKSMVCESPNGVTYGGWQDEFRRLQKNKFARVQVYNFWTKLIDLHSLEGYVYVDIENLHYELYTPDSGVDGQDYTISDGNPFEIAKNIRASGFKQDYGRFNIWSFFPAPSFSQLAWAATFFTHDGLEDWDANFQKHVWLMHTLIAHKGLHVNAIIRDRATTRRNIYHIATQLTLYRIFEKVKDTLPGLDTVATHEYVNDFGEKFEHRCPVGWILGGAISIHSNHSEDRVWKLSCVRVNWVSRTSLWYDFNSSRWRSDLHDIIWRPNTEVNALNNWDSVLNYGWYDCNRAITGIGGVHNNLNEDRRFWLYSSDVIGAHSFTCKWTGWINEWDGPMDTSVGVNQYIGAVYSVYDNKREDRRWQFCLCDKF